MNKIAFQEEVFKRIEFPYENEHTSYNLKDFSCHIFYHPNVPENEAAEIYLKEERIGWIFPIIRIESNAVKLENEKSQSFLVKHMEIAVRLLIQQYEDEIFQMLEKYPEEQIKCSEILNQRAVIFIESKETSSKLSFNFKQYYFYFLLEYHLTSKDLGEYEATSLKLGKRIKLGELSQELIDEEFIIDTFPVLYESTFDNEFLRFTVLYQVIEFFIEKILHPTILKEIGKKHETHQLKKRLFDITSEKERIKLLFHQHITIDNTAIDKMKDAYDEFLKYYVKRSDDLTNVKKGLDNETSTHAQVYFIRNKLYHEMRSFNKEFITNGCLLKINDSLAYIIKMIFINFKSSVETVNNYV